MGKRKDKKKKRKEKKENDKTYVKCPHGHYAQIYYLCFLFNFLHQIFFQQSTIKNLLFPSSLKSAQPNRP